MRSPRRTALATLGVLSVFGLTALAGCGGGEDSTAGTGVQPVPTGSDVAVSSPDPGASPSAPVPAGTGIVTPTPTYTGARTSRSVPASAPVPWDNGTLPSPAAVRTAASGAAKLSILLDDGFGIRSTWALTCDPPGGTHPDPVMACGVLGAHGATALPAPSPTTACTEQYGGPQKAKITGTWRGKAVNAELSLENGCQIARWTALLGLLPAGGITQ